jgi:3-methyladenine DNA glycosylase AlkD
MNGTSEKRYVGLRRRVLMQYKDVLDQLKAQANPDAVAGMVRYGINPERTYGVSIPALRKMARKIGKNHELAQQFWASGIHEARILASMVDQPGSVTEAQMERWAKDFDSWDVCDQCCNNLFRRIAFAYQKADEWHTRPEEFVKRAGFVLMACLAVHDKQAGDEAFVAFLPAIKSEATDERNFVKKAVNWALRQIGKRNLNLNEAAIQTAGQIQEIDSKTARWIASNALRELTSDKVQQRLRETTR